MLRSKLCTKLRIGKSAGATAVYHSSPIRGMVFSGSLLRDWVPTKRRRDCYKIIAVSVTPVRRDHGHDIYRAQAARAW